MTDSALLFDPRVIRLCVLAWRIPGMGEPGGLPSMGSNQSILMEINPEYSLEGLMLNLKLQYFGHLIRRADSLGKTLMPRASSAKTRGFHTQLDEGPETP